MHLRRIFCLYETIKKASFGILLNKQYQTVQYLINKCHKRLTWINKICNTTMKLPRTSNTSFFYHLSDLWAITEFPTELWLDIYSLRSKQQGTTLLKQLFCFVFLFLELQLFLTSTVFWWDSLLHRAPLISHTHTGEERTRTKETEWVQEPKSTNNMTQTITKSALNGGIAQQQIVEDKMTQCIMWFTGLLQWITFSTKYNKWFSPGILPNSL